MSVQKFATFCLLVFTAQAWAGEKYDRALVFQGGGFQTAMFLGMMEGAELSGMKPDVVIGTCGGSIAAAIVNAFPTSAERREFIESEEYHAFIKRIQFNENQRLDRAASVILGMRDYVWDDRIPNIFSDYLMNVPMKLDIPAMQKPLGNTQTHVIIVAGELSYDEKSVGEKRANRKLYTETYFTDAQTAELLEGYPSPVGAFFPQSAVNADTRVYTGVTAGEATRASISDPFYMYPAKIGDHSYLTGAIDLYPMELAHQVAKDVAVNFSPEFDPVEESAIQATFRYTPNQRLRHVNDLRADHWVDISDSPDYTQDYGFNPKPNLKKFRVMTSIPKNLEEYRKHVEALWAYGRERALEAYRVPQYSKFHIRNLTEKNSSKALRTQLQIRINNQ